MTTTSAAYQQEQPFSDGPYTCQGQMKLGFQSVVVALTAEVNTIGWGDTTPFTYRRFPKKSLQG